MEILHWEKINECVSTQGIERDVTTPKTNVSQDNALKNLWNKIPILFWSVLGQEKSTCDVTRPVGYFQYGLVLPSIPGEVI